MLQNQLIFFIAITLCSANPIRKADVFTERGFILTSNTAFGLLIGVTSLVCFLLFSIICVCCNKNSLFKSWKRQRQYRRNVLQTRNGHTNGNEISVFPPPGFQPHSGSTSEIYFEPLPDITPRLCKQRNNNDDWFADPHKNFPRPQLQYVQKLGSGWFGQVLLGRAIGIESDHTSTPANSKTQSKSTPVVVKSLREDASIEEQTIFLQELKPYRDLKHSNVLRIQGTCLEKHPYLVMLEFCPKGDLKSVLKKDKSLTTSSLVKMCQDVSAGLAHMHQYNFIHTDLAARNCLVKEDLTIKIGDYGFKLDTGCYKNEYYLAENVALPLRWSAPESLKCTDTTIEAIQLTKEANIWSLGVVIWEVLSRGELPYADLDEDSVIQQVLLEGTRRLQIPTSLLVHAEKVDRILHQCWLASHERPAAAHINSLMEHLFHNIDLSDNSVNDFEQRWNQLSKTKENNLHITECNGMKLESEFEPAMSSPTPSLKNFHGSAEDLDARVAAKFGSAVPSWLGLGPDQVMDSLTEEITDAIQRLDEALAGEKSEPSSSIASPEKSISANFKLGRDSLVNNPPGLGLNRSLSDREEDNLTLRLEMGDFSELVRRKSQSVQDLMRLTVVDDGSDSDKTSQPGSLIGDFNTQNLIPEKNFSSEGNLKEASRDAGFLFELEKYQALKFSIISEVSQDGMYSMEYFKHFSEMPETDSQALPIDKDKSTSLNAKEQPFLVMNVLSSESKDKIFIDNESYSEIQAFKQESFKQKEASPDCILNTRGNLNCASLPDIVAHDANRKLIYRSSNSSLEDETSESLTESEDKSKTDGSDTPSDIFPPKEIEITSLNSETDYDDLYGINNFSSNLIHSSLIDDQDELIPLQSNSVSPENCSDYSPQQVIKGEEVIFGALEHYSLEFFKSSMNSYVNDGNQTSVGLSENADSCNKTSEDNLFVTNNQSNQICKVENLEDKPENTGSIKDDCSSVTEKIVTNYSNGADTDCYSVDSLEDDLKNTKELAKVYSYNLTEKIVNDTIKNLVLCDRFDSGNSSLNTSQDLQDSDSKNEGDVNFIKREAYSNCDSNESCKEEHLTEGIITNKDKALDHVDVATNQNTELQPIEKPENENDVFWERQMSAWQEAAAETKELLLQAANKELELTQDSEDDLDENRSNSHTPRSDGGRSKSPYSSTDKLDTDDEGTYVSYATDDEVLRYSPEELSALRSELCLMLEDSNDSLQEEGEESINDSIYINYRGSRSMLSPIKEECYEGDLFDAVGTTEEEDDNDSSIEFTECLKFSENIFNKTHDTTCLVFPLTSESSPVPVPNLCFTDFDRTSEETKDSLILEDLENDGTPTSSQILVGPIAQDENGEDLLVIDTETNKVTLIDSGRSPPTIAFSIEKIKEEIPGISQEQIISFDVDDDVAPESLPYESSGGKFNSLPFTTTHDELEKPQVSSYSDESVFDNDKIPHYHNYFTSGLSSMTYPTASIEGNALVESVDHISLPYNVNFQTPYENHSPETKVALEIPPADLSDESKKKYSIESENEALILDDSKGKSEEEKEFVTLSFLGRLYNNEQSEQELIGHERDSDIKEKDVPVQKEGLLSTSYYSKSDADLLQNLSDSEVDEDFIPEENKNEETPLRTPSHLVDFVWRADTAPMEESCYTPDWEAGSDSENEEFESSSTSGEFIWQPGDSQTTQSSMCQPSPERTMLASLEEEENEDEDVVADDYEDESESGEEDFTPSTWNNLLTPQRSLIKLPETITTDKKSVHWKRQRHHRVYEYPPEPQSWHAEFPSSQNSRRTWKTHSLDYLTLADWEIGGDDFLGDDTEDFEEYFTPQHGSYASSRIYNMNPDQQVDDFMGDKCDFYIGSPGSPFSFSRSSFAPSDFFQNKPTSSTSSAPMNYDYIFSNDATVSEEKYIAEDNGNGSCSPQQSEVVDQFDNESEDHDKQFYSDSNSKLSREKLRLDLPTLCLAEEPDINDKKEKFSASNVET